MSCPNKRSRRYAQTLHSHHNASRLLTSPIKLPNTDPEPEVQLELRAESHKGFMDSLFTEGRNSDIMIDFACERFKSEKKQMRLHKLMLLQMPYFEALLGGQWAEANKDMITISIADENITERSLDLIFKSLYTGHLTYGNSEDDLISLLATSRMFNLDETADHVAQDMNRMAEIGNVIYFYYSFESYGYPVLCEKMLEWIAVTFSYWNEFNHDIFCSQVLNKIESSLMERIITHDNFLVKNEPMLYSILKRWMVNKVKMRDGYDFFKVWNRPQPFLETEEGKEFERIFSMVKINHLLMDVNSLELLKKDNFFPDSCIQRAGAENFIYMEQLASTLLTPNMSSQSFRISINQHPIFKANKGANVNYFGIHLKFAWNGRMLTVQRNRRDKETMFHHGPVAVVFSVVFYNPIKRYDTPQYFGPIEHTIQENELVNLVEWKEGKDCLKIDDYPKVVGIKMNFKKVDAKVEEVDLIDDDE